jgi:hypothetical protein
MLDFQRGHIVMDVAAWSKGRAMNFSCSRQLNKYINFLKDKLLTHVHEFLKLTVKF